MPFAGFPLNLCSQPPWQKCFSASRMKHGFDSPDSSECIMVALAATRVGERVSGHTADQLDCAQHRRGPFAATRAAPLLFSARPRRSQTLEWGLQLSILRIAFTMLSFYSLGLEACEKLIRKRHLAPSCNLSQDRAMPACTTPSIFANLVL